VSWDSLSGGLETAQSTSSSSELSAHAVSLERRAGTGSTGIGRRRLNVVTKSSIAPSRDGKYIVVKVVGEYTRAHAMRDTIEAHALGKKLGTKRYLMDVSGARNVESTLGNYEIAHKDIPTTPGIDKTARVAILVDPSDHSHDFAETTARNAGLAVTLFRDRALAEAYLREETDPKNQ